MLLPMDTFECHLHHFRRDFAMAYKELIEYLLCLILLGKL